MGGRSERYAVESGLKNWFRERWRRLFLRESTEQAGEWLLMQRGTQSYCIKMAEDDGTIVRLRGRTNIAEVTAVALRAKPKEFELACEAIKGLLDDGFLAIDDDRVFVVNLPAAQGDDDLGATELAEAASSPVKRPRGPALSPADRQRARRERIRKERDARDLSHEKSHEPSEESVTKSHELERDGPSRSHVTVSRGDNQNETSESILAKQTSQTNQPNKPARERDNVRDTAPVTSRDGDGDVSRDEAPLAAGKVACPGDLQLTASQRSTLLGGFIPEWAIDLLTTKFVSTHGADPNDKRTMVHWRKCLSISICGDWNNAAKRPKKPEEGQEDSISWAG